MPYELFYEGHTWLTVSYRKAHRIKREQDNFDKYLMGTYVYDIVCRCAPIFNAFAKGKVQPWLEHPYAIYEDEKEAVKKAAQSKGKAFMESYMARHNIAMSMSKSAEDPEDE